MQQEKLTIEIPIPKTDLHKEIHYFSIFNFTSTYLEINSLKIIQISNYIFTLELLFLFPIKYCPLNNKRIIEYALLLKSS